VPRDTRSDQAHGERDGRANYPKADRQTFGGHEMDLVNQARADIASLKLKLQIDGLYVSSSTTARKQQRYEEHASHLRDLANQRDAAVARATKKYGASTPSALRELEQLTEAQQAYEDLQRDEGGREPQMRAVAPKFFGITPYGWVVGAMTTVELVLNKGAFRDLLQQGPLGSYGGAFVMGLAIVLFAHLLGVFVRQAKFRRGAIEKLKVWVGIPTIVIVVTIALLVFELSAVREGILTDTDGYPLKQNFLGLSHSGMVLYLLNLTVFFGGAFLSFLRHDPHPDMEALLNAYRSAEEKVERRRADYERELAEIDEDHRRKRANLNARADRLQREIDDDHAKAESLPDRIDAEIERVVAVTCQRILAYQKGNESMREDLPPDYFGTPSTKMARALIMGEEPALEADAFKPYAMA
jgi:hypothetical protein